MTAENGRRDFGFYIERKAEEWYLRQPGYRFVDRNYRCHRGEIDLIFEQLKNNRRTELVFVEVRARQSGSWQSGVESVDFKKRIRLRRAIEQFLLGYRGAASSLRTDVLAWDGTNWQQIEKIGFESLRE